jgi:large subunit ribosomal protein L15
MELHDLPKISASSKKRLGRGIGSGRGKTSGRGQKGQKARGKIPAANVGAGLILYKKLPFKRGWGNRKTSAKVTTVTLEQLNILTANTKVDLACLIDHKLVTPRKAHRGGVKILAQGQLKKAFIVELPVSQNAKAKIEQAGGSVLG